MTSEPDSPSGRRPPTIELKATEVREADAGATRAGEQPKADAANARPDTGAAATQSAGGSGRRLKSHALSASFGAVAAAVVIGAFWLWGFVPSREAAPAAQQVAPVNAPASPAPPAAAGTPQTQSDILTRPDRIDRAMRPRPGESAATERVAALEAQAKSLGDSLTLLSRRVDDIAAASQNAAKQADAAQAAAEAAKSASAAAGQAGAQKSDLDALADRIAALESAVKALAEDVAQRTPAADDRAARLALSAEALRAAVERGTPYQAELGAVEALGVDRDAAAALEPFAATGLPDAAALARQLAALIPALRQASETAAGASTFLSRLEDNARHLVRITPVHAPAGNDPASVLARIEADCARADIATALTDVALLPDAAKSPAADWLKTAQAREAAIVASRRIAAGALAALDKPAAQ